MALIGLLAVLLIGGVPIAALAALAIAERCDRDGSWEPGAYP